ncbi:hypothetical protein A6M27_10745 [Acidithiobacillus thiooxidans]|uniref:Uncharacterized protein n=1 Tax=Acidithiobacillus thiooxidans TaxID=930 RepID=A0A1C2JFY0_ACITH|nr:hypothetical protein [Acidithiobacillus thiooxidans]OCX68703.1 hypothetical protein A6O24_19440 [Acidithiobacillus thiooxidans]OCX71831.1 hypothetical protein A6P07_11220 [Acidithiobacillus thiooxidans]OCX76809.1 hypothetical protein A6O26_20720 [Acidithiobacillus thiooxidans]OCX87153.1 hypothetical protein A6M27_10745 [Acidithiobacillus thiooxidans]OFC49622.1 hypothetical protein BAE47_04675 [Acidithiobacillus thiooxidans]
MNTLKDLIAQGPDERYVVKAKVIEQFNDIDTARDLMRTWPDITEALGFERGKWKQISACFRRVKSGIASGKLKIPDSTKRKRVDDVFEQRKQGKSGSRVIDLDDPSNQ